MPYKLIPPGKRRFWYVRGTVDRQRFEVSTGETDRRRAETWAAKYVGALGSDAVPDGESVTFDRAADAFMAWRRPGREDERLIKAVAGWFADKPLREIRHAHAVEAANALRPKGSGPTKNRKVIVPIAAVMHYAAEQGWVDYRRFKKFKEATRSPRRPVSDPVMGSLMAAVDGPKRAILAVLYETGLRITDALNIEWAALNLAAGQLHAKVGKTDERITIPLSAPLVAILANLPKSARYVFPWRTRRGVYVWLKPLREKLGVAYTPHQSRHALATAAQAAGMADREAADLGAWRDARSLHRYQHVRPSGVAGRSVGNLVAPVVAKPAKVMKGK